jgi:hypothetical protein
VTASIQGEGYSDLKISTAAPTQIQDSSYLPRYAEGERSSPCPSSDMMAAFPAPSASRSLA